MRRQTNQFDFTVWTGLLKENCVIFCVSVCNPWSQLYSATIQLKCREDTFGKCGLCVLWNSICGWLVLIDFLTVSELTMHSRFIILPNQPEGGSKEENAKWINEMGSVGGLWCPLVSHHVSINAACSFAENVLLTSPGLSLSPSVQPPWRTVKALWCFQDRTATTGATGPRRASPRGTCCSR